MKIDTINPTLSRIYTTNENIKGMLGRLKIIMDENGFRELNDEYLILAKEVPKDEELSEFEKTFESFGTDLKYSELDIKLRAFEGNLQLYNEFKELSDVLNRVKVGNKNAFLKDSSMEKFISDNKKLIDLLIQVKNSKNIQLFTSLIDDSIKTLFSSLKTLSLIGNNELINTIGLTYSDYLKEHIASEVREQIDVSSFEGQLEDDYVDFETIYKCALNDEEIITRRDEALSFEARQAEMEKARNDRISYLQERFKEFENNIKKYKDELKKLKLSKNCLKAKRLFLRMVLVPAVAVPLACPFIGRNIGLKASSKVLLTKTITNTVDTDSGDIIESDAKYEELKTDYVASVTICDAWKKNASGTSYVRNCVVYDYDFSDLGEIEDDFHLTLENIKPENLIKKYTYQEPTDKVENEKYLTDSQVLITETYQDNKDTEISTKYNLPYTVAGVGVGGIILTSEILAYCLLGRNFKEKLDRKIAKDFSENEKKTTEVSKTLKLTLDSQKNAKEEYGSLTSKR